MSGLPQLTTEKRGTSGIYRYTSRDIIQTFKGYNHKRRIADGEFYETNGVCADEYPVMRTCPARKIQSNSSGGVPVYTGIECLYMIDNAIVLGYEGSGTGITVAYGKKTVNIPSAENYHKLDVNTKYCTNTVTVTYTPSWLNAEKPPYDHSLAITYSSGAWLVTSEGTATTPSTYGLTVTGTGAEGDVIYVRNTRDGFFHPVRLGNRLWMYPSTKYIDIDTWTLGDLTNAFTGTGITVTPCDAEGSTITISSTQPSSPTDGQYWLDGSTLKQYSSLYGSWISVGTTYVKLTATNIGTGFEEADGITISGFTDSDLAFLNTDGAHVTIKSVSTNQIVLVGLLGASKTEPSSVTIARDIPDMDFIVAHNNRIWGCSNSNHEIYACKLGDMKNWYVYQNIASDAYTATCIPEHAFTGAGEVGSYVVFFTETQIFRISGTRPANFTITEVTAHGISETNGYSIATINEALYYLGEDGIYRYSGSMPTKIVDGIEKGYTLGHAAATTGKYILSAYKSQYEMFCYDSNYGTFYKFRESAYPIADEGIVANSESFAYFKSEPVLYGGKVLALEGETGNYGSTVSEAITWLAETGEIGLSLADQKYVSKIILRMELAENATCVIYASYDDGAYEQILSVTGDGTLRSHTATIIPQRCDHAKLKLTGTGECHLYSISKQIEQGSEVV